MKTRESLLKMTERELQNLVVQTANYYHWLEYHTYDSRRSRAGFPDLVLLKPPRIIYAELKTDKGRLSAEQDAWLSLLGQLVESEVYVWRPHDWATGRIVDILKPT